jgi:hypothetical protein
MAIGQSMRTGAHGRRYSFERNWAGYMTYRMTDGAKGIWCGSLDLGSGAYRTFRCCTFGLLERLIHW